jgi:hybrid cluster-associated redox disulfide protein
MISRKMSIGEVVRKYPKTVQTFESHGMGCCGCEAALFESIEEGAEVHGIDISGLISELNREVAGKGK